MATGRFEDRLTFLETEVARLRGRMESAEQSGKPWWEQIAGSFANDPIYEEAMRLGREYRQSLRPKQPKRRIRRNGRPRH